MNRRKNHPFPTLQRAIKLLSPRYPGIFDESGQAVPVQYENQAKGSGKLQIYFSEEMQFLRMAKVRKNRREIIISDFDAEGENHPCQIADYRAKSKNCRDREEIYKKNNGSQKGVFEFMFNFHGGLGCTMLAAYVGKRKSSERGNTTTPLSF